ncbi:MAG: hypothetical protein JNK04_16775 [Myxococcales bacterium]|nr:hypothetical protein [Myxococcales bacterium]
MSEGLPVPAAPTPPEVPPPKPAPPRAVFTSNQTYGRVVADPKKGPNEEEEEKRKRTLAKLKEHYGKPDFYDQLAEYDPKHADWWKQMSGVQQTYHVTHQPHRDDA